MNRLFSGGYAGKILRVDVSDRRYWVDEIDLSLVSDYIGGVGMAARLLTQLMPPEVSALDARNMLAFFGGPLCGLPVPCSSKFVVAGKSPLTGLLFHSVCGGSLGVAMKRAGYDGLILQGVSEDPVWVEVRDGEVKFRPAAFMWGASTSVTEQLVKSNSSRDAEVAAIGLAGENGVSFACIIQGGRAAGRGGLGAVMGRKKVKAISFVGSGEVRAADPDRLAEWARFARQELRAHPGTGSALPTYGTPGTVALLNSKGVLGTRNWHLEWFERAQSISGQTLRERHYVKNTACFACPIACSRLSRVSEGLYAGAETEGPEYETIYALGSMCENDDLASIILMDRLCDEYGMDTISAGVVLAFVMDCFEHGMLTKEDTGGLELRFGDHRGMVAALRQIACSSGFGREMALGSRALAQRLGGRAPELAAHVRGLEIAGHSPRGVYMMGLGMATSPRGGSHQDSRPTLEYDALTQPGDASGKARAVAETQKMCAVGDSLVLCRFVERVYGYTLTWNRESGQAGRKAQMYVEPLRLATGLDFSLEHLQTVGERIWTLIRTYNLACGMTPADVDVLPRRLLEERIPSGPAEGKGLTREELRRMLREYYAYVGWDDSGRPKPETLSRLRLGG